MSAFESVEVPFMTLGNRRVLTVEQLANDPNLEDFVRRFPACFEYAPNGFYLVFYPDGEGGGYDRRK